jgi:hypothetical protein
MAEMIIIVKKNKVTANENEEDVKINEQVVEVVSKVVL